VANNAKAIFYIARTNRLAKKGPPSDAVQIAAFTNKFNDWHAPEIFLRFYPIPPSVQMAVAKHYVAEKEPDAVLEYLRDSLDAANSLDPRVETFLNQQIDR